MPSSATSPGIKELLETTADELSTCKRLLELIAVERTAIIGDRLDDLIKAVDEKERLTNRLNRLESKRIRLAERMAPPHRTTSPEADTNDANTDEHRQLARMAAELRAVARQVVEKNRANVELLQDFLRVTQDMLHGLLIVAGVDAGYSPAGQVQTSLVIESKSINRRA